LYNEAGTLTNFSGNTVAGNEANSGGGIYNLSGSFTLSNNILGDNTSGDCGYASTAPVSSGYNLVEDVGGCGSVFNQTGDQTGLDPALNPLADNGCAVLLPDGSCVETMTLQNTSPAIDAGSCTVSGLATDQRGEARPVDLVAVTDADDGCDIGAVELQELLYPAPTILAVETACDSLSLRYIAHGQVSGGTAEFRVYRATDDGLVASASLPASEDGELYEVTLSLERLYPEGMAFYLQIPTATGMLTTPAQACRLP
jgi:hypothetical protein